MIQVLSRTREILQHVAESSSGLRLFELTDLMGLKRSTVHNVASSLVHEGMLAKDENSKYQLGPLFKELYLTQQQNESSKAIREIMLRFAYLVKDSHLTYAKFGEYEILEQCKITPDQPYRIRTTSGYTLNPYFTVSGILHFAFLPTSKLNLLKMRHPFIPKGLELWKDEKLFKGTIGKCKKNGYALLPIDPPEIFRLGIPIKLNGSFFGTLTWSKNNCKKEEKEIMLKNTKIDI